MRFTILFHAPYWIGLLEDERDGYLYAARHIFGSEPSDQEVYEVIQRDLLHLIADMQVGIPVDSRALSHAKNPKRMQREARREVAEVGMSTKAQTALKAEFEARKTERHSVAREEREAEKAHKRAIAREKAKAKHRGR